jgi:hypothetical protein
VVNATARMLNAALAGFGLAYVPEDLAQPHLANGGLKRALGDWCPPFSGYHLYYPSRPIHARLCLARRSAALPALNRASCVGGRYHPGGDTDAFAARRSFQITHFSSIRGSGYPGPALLLIGVIHHVAFIVEDHRRAFGLRVRRPWRNGGVIGAA